MRFAFQGETAMRHTTRDLRNRRRNQKAQKKLRQLAKQKKRAAAAKA
jgi:hypothetical protein